MGFWSYYSSLPIALAAAIYLSEIAKKRTRNLLRPLIELLAFHLLFMVFLVGWLSCPLIQSLFGYPVGETALGKCGASQSYHHYLRDAMRNTPRAMKD
jgi:phosphate transport system permease protein